MSARPRWVVYGSSLSAECVRWAPWRACGGSWVAARRGARPDLEIVNRSGWGWTSRDAVRAFGPRVLALRPAGAILEFTINDADDRRHCSVEDSAANLETMLAPTRPRTPMAGRSCCFLPHRSAATHWRARASRPMPTLGAAPRPRTMRRSSTLTRRGPRSLAPTPPANRCAAPTGFTSPAPWRTGSPPSLVPCSDRRTDRDREPAAADGPSGEVTIERLNAGRPLPNMDP